MNRPRHTIIQGKSISKPDKELVESILAGEMKNAWQKGDGVDQRDDFGPYAKKSWQSKHLCYRNNYDQINWRG